jgi:RNA polymerase sigma-70 factor (ECF subfamily)
MLLRQIATAQDRAAFGDLFRQFSPKVRAYALRMGASNASADELVQEVMLSVWRKAQLYDAEKANASTWIYAIARNRLLDEFRRPAPPTVEPEAVDEERQDDPDHELRIDSQRAATRLKAALETLPEEQSEVLRIAYYEGVSQRDLSVRLGLPLGTVKSRTRLALERLRDALKTET